MRESPPSTTAQSVSSAELLRPENGGVEGPLRSLVAAAVRAPSGDNLQPWRFVVDADTNRISLYVDETRDRTPMNADQRMSRVAVGAALENILQAAQSLHWRAEIEEPRDSALAVVCLSGIDDSAGEVDPTIAARVTNRRAYDGSPVPPQLLAELVRRTPELDGVTTHWIHQRSRISEMASLMGRSDALMFRVPSMRSAFVDNVRFDATWDAEVEEGLSLASLEVSAMQRIALRMMPRIPDWLLKAAGGMRAFAAAARKLVASSSGLCVVVAPDSSQQADVNAGRAAERAWLALTSGGMAVQPMMSLAVLESLLSRGTTELLKSLGRQSVAALVEEFHALVPEIGHGDPVFILRFGFARPPTARTGRLPLEANTSLVPSSDHTAT